MIKFSYIINIFVPRSVAEVSPYLKKEIYRIVHLGNSYII